MFSFFIVYVNHAMPSRLARHHICEFCNATLVRQSSCELYHAIIFYYVLNLSKFLEHSITLPVHQPFDTAMEKSGVETRSSEQTMLSDEVHVLLVTDTYSE